MATQDSPNLYERLGGVYSIATVVDDLIDRVMTDPRTGMALPFPLWPPYSGLPASQSAQLNN